MSTRLFGFVVLLLTGCGGGDAAAPPAKTAVAEPAAKESHEDLNVMSEALHVVVSRDPGTIIINGRKVTSSELGTQVQGALKAQPALRFVVDAEADIPYGRVVEAMNLLKQAGATKLSIGSVAPSLKPTMGSEPPPAASAAPPSRPADPIAQVDPSTKWECELPPPSERGSATDVNVMVRVIVDNDGSPIGVDVMGDPAPAPAFAEAARRCAMGKKYLAAKGPSGEPTRGKTFPFVIRFDLR
jgi:biopolymer transport protein ExbD